MKKCLVFDDHTLVREALSGTVRLAWPHVEIITAVDWPQSWQAAHSDADIALVDLVMPGAHPIDGISKLIDLVPTVPILVITGTDDDHVMLDLLELGVAGFTSKTASGGVIEAAIRLILAGGRYLPERVATIAAARQQALAATRSPSEQSCNESLAAMISERQVDVLRLVAQGLSNKEIGRKLGIAPSTIKTHLDNAREALGAMTRTDAAIKAKHIGLI
jgi:DNA-binding NarL/FixJ family response regulator